MSSPIVAVKDAVSEPKMSISTGIGPMGIGPMGMSKLKPIDSVGTVQVIRFSFWPSRMPMASMGLSKSGNFNPKSLFSRFWKNSLVLMGSPTV